MQYTEKAFSALSEQDFWEAQGFFRKEIKENPASPEEQAEMEALLSEFKKD